MAKGNRIWELVYSVWVWNGWGVWEGDIKIMTEWSEHSSGECGVGILYV